MSANDRYNLVTRSDFDGLVCAVLLKEMEMLEEIRFVHPKDMQDGKVEVDERVITTNLPYVENCHLAFDHHASELLRLEGVARQNHIIDPDAPSAARVVYEYYGGSERFENVAIDMMDAVDRSDSAQFRADEILNPKGWVLLNFLMDARTGLGRFRNFRISNYQLMMDLIDHCRTKSIAEILELPDVAERVRLYREHETKFRAQLERCTTIHDNLAVVDLREEDVIYAGNRFVIYALHPDCNISMHAMWGLRRQNTVFALGNSIVNRSSKTNVGALCLGYGGGGHRNAGTCQVSNDDADRVRDELIVKITANG